VHTNNQRKKRMKRLALLLAGFAFLGAISFPGGYTKAAAEGKANALRHFPGDFHAVKKVSFPQKKRIRVR
jgi:hypothetical protein